MMQDVLFGRLNRFCLCQQDTGGQMGREYAPVGEDAPPRPTATPKPTKIPRPPAQESGGSSGNGGDMDWEEDLPAPTPDAEVVQAADNSFSSYSVWEEQTEAPVQETEAIILDRTGEMATHSVWEQPSETGSPLTEGTGMMIMLLLGVVAVLLAVQIVLTGALLRRFPRKRKDQLTKTRTL